MTKPTWVEVLTGIGRLLAELEPAKVKIEATLPGGGKLTFRLDPTKPAPRELRGE